MPLTAKRPGQVRRFPEAYARESANRGQDQLGCGLGDAAAGREVTPCRPPRLRRSTEFPRCSPSQLIGDNAFMRGETWVGDCRIATLGSILAVVREGLAAATGS
ncbi:hypothetical protein GCM10009578_100450 [Streptomyces rhizosphaericus]